MFYFPAAVGAAATFEGPGGRGEKTLGPRPEMFEVCVKGVERKLVDEKEGVWWEDVQVRLLGVYVSSSRDRLVAFFPVAAVVGEI